MQKIIDSFMKSFKQLLLINIYDYIFFPKKLLNKKKILFDYMGLLGFGAFWFIILLKI